MDNVPSSEVLGIPQILGIQKNRFPSLFVDKIEEVVPGEYAKGVKNFTYNEWFFPSHFPNDPSVPGYILIEATTQVFLMSFLTLPENKGEITAFISVENFHFKRKIVPGDQLIVEAKLIDYRRGIAIGEVLGFVGGELAVSGRLKVGVPRILNEILDKVTKKNT